LAIFRHYYIDVLIITFPVVLSHPGITPDPKVIQDLSNKNCVTVAVARSIPPQPGRSPDLLHARFVELILDIGNDKFIDIPAGISQGGAFQDRGYCLGVLHGLILNFLDMIEGREHAAFPDLRISAFCGRKILVVFFAWQYVTLPAFHLYLEIPGFC
jgi:hypothetical protein